MGLFQQRPEEHQVEWAGLPSEPRDTTNVADALNAASDIDPATVYSATTTSIVFPLAPPAPDASDVATGEPGDPEDG